MDLNLLRSLRALIKERHVGRAADSMCVTQPAMSHSLRKLREHFDDPLLVRTGKHMKLTPRAVELSAYLERIFSEIAEMSDLGELHPEKIKRTFSIHTHDFLIAEILAEPMQRIQEQAPDLDFAVNVCTPTSYKLLDEGKIDLVVGRENKNYASLRNSLIREDPRVCLLDVNHPALNDWSAEAVFRYPHVTLSYSDRVHDPVSTFANAHGFKRKVRITTEHLYMQKPFLEGSDLIAFLPKLFAEQASSSGKLKAMPGPFDLSTVAISMLWSEINENDPAHKWVRGALSE